MAEDLALLFRGSGRTTLDVVTLDALVRATPVYSSEITDHPVEQGANITDHARNKPVSLSIEGLLSNTPISADGLTRAVSTGGVVFESAADESVAGAAGYAEAAYAKLLDLQATKRAFTVVTSRRTYTNMMLEEISDPLDNTSGDAIRFTAKLKQIVVAASKSIVVDVRKPAARKKEAKGKQGAEAPKDKPRYTSTLLDMQEGASGYVDKLFEVKRANRDGTPIDD